MCAAVLIAEDDEKQAELVRRYLEREGHTVTVVHDGNAALAAVRNRPPDLLILDVMMPGKDGLAVTRTLRGGGVTPEVAQLPILMLTARSTEDDLLEGLDLGADDYLTKPYSPRELMARVRTLLRRACGIHAPSPDTGRQVLRAGDLVVDPRRHEVTVDGRPIECTPGEFDLLTALASDPDRVFTRPQLLDRIHGSSGYISARTVDVHVLNLRKKIEPDPRHPTRLLTIFGVGYKLTSTSTSASTTPARAAEPGGAMAAAGPVEASGPVGTLPLDGLPGPAIPAGSPTMPTGRTAPTRASTSGGASRTAGAAGPALASPAAGAMTAAGPTGSARASAPAPGGASRTARPSGPDLASRTAGLPGPDLASLTAEAPRPGKASPAATAPAPANTPAPSPAPRAVPRNPLARRGA